MNEIRFADARDLEAIRRIWSAVFTADTPAERDAFLDAVHVSEECVVVCENDVPISMAFFLPAVLHIQNRAYTARYLYAAATLPAYRGKGIFSDLLNAALTALKQRGVDACFLNPAEPSLVGFYRRFGFEPTIFSRTISGTSTTKALPIQPLSAEDYIALRQTLLPPDHVAWDDRLLRYAVSYAKPIRIGERACALCAKNNGTLHVLELLGIPSDEQTAVCGALAHDQGCNVFRARVFSEMGDCFGMLLSLGERIPLKPAPYMGLAFD
ncbi:MAG: GNAT family N-acetyltransferase [Clostridia bacterium]|nr:GNAT family N-acetyltransferase [Clostridia bacterium]